MRKLIIATLLGVTGALVALAVGCHADENDPAGQAKELADPVRRENAIANITRLYTNALSKNNGNRQAAEVKAIADEVHDELTATYLEHPEDTQSGRKILDLFGEMRDPRTIPALLKALEWRTEVTEEHAISAAKTLASLEIPADKKAEVVAKLGEALERINGPRPVDNRMRIELIRALGAIGDRRATPVLTKIATAQVEEQNFLINRLAGEQLARMGDPEAVPAMIKALFLFAPGRADMRMNDVATQALVAIGRPALEPLLRLLRGEDAESNAIAEAYIAAVREINPQAAGEMSARSITANEASISLGQLGLREAIEPLLQETQLPVARANEEAPDTNETRRIAAAIALASINRTDADTPRIREALIRVYNASEKVKRMQLLVVMQHANDPGLLPFLLEQARRPEDELPDIRVIALKVYSFLANASEAAAARAVIAAEPEDGFKRQFEENNPALAAAQECNEDVACWIRKLSASNERVVRKAAYMLARYGRGNAQVITALIGKLNHPEEEVRGDVLYSLDFVANAGSQAAVDRIEALRAEEEGRAIWNHVKEVALSVQARLRARTPQGQ